MGGLDMVEEIAQKLRQLRNGVDAVLQGLVEHLGPALRAVPLRSSICHADTTESERHRSRSDE
jgi:hypothetical protein